MIHIKTNITLVFVVMSSNSLMLSQYKAKAKSLSTSLGLTLGVTFTFNSKPFNFVTNKILVINLFFLCWKSCCL